MKKRLTMIIILASMMISFSQTIWNGEKIIFSKADYADATLAENQDRITDSTWVTRNDTEGLYNAYYEGWFNPDTPTNTEWAYGTTAGYDTLSYKSWVDWHGWTPPSAVGRDAVLHLISEDIYIDIKFTYWSEGEGDKVGGGFTYERSTYVPLVLWSGPTMTFEKIDLVDWTLPENQDRMTDSTWLARKDISGMFNAAMEDGYVTTSPENTEWAYGTLLDHNILTFQTWTNWHGSNPTSSIGQNAVLHLIDEHIYMDIKFTSYSGGGPGGGFAYERSTPPLFAGLGTIDNPYQITNIDQLQGVNYYLDAHFIVMNDIDASATSTWNDGSGFDPIGNNGFTDGFTGSFDGMNYNISNLYIDRPEVDYIGLFGITGDSSQISNVNLDNINFTGLNLVGGISSKNNGLIIDCFTSGIVTKTDGLVPGIGGIVGWNNGTVMSNFSSASVNGTQYVGGLVGYNKGNITNCYATGNASATGKYVGGLVAFANGGVITNCYSIGPATGTDNVGGFAGYNSGTAVINCFWDTEASDNSTSAAGTGKTTSEMKDQVTFTNWDFTTPIWYIKINFNSGYPFLKAQELIPFAGVGTEENPYQVSNATQLNEVRNYLDSYFIQTADIDLGVEPWNIGEGWVPIGDNVTPYTGNYNGDSYKISNLTINNTGSNVGLFGDVTSADISNVAVLDANVIVTGGEITGILIGISDGSTILNCSSSGSVNGDVAVGGLIGSSESSSTVSGCYSLASVQSSEQVGGGLIGGSLGSLVINSYAMGDVTSSIEAGGLIGYTEGASIENCYSTGFVSGTTDFGGLIGIDATKGKNIITNSYWDIDTSGQEISAGGEGKTTAEMKLQTTYVDWDFTTPVWMRNTTANNGYPYLEWQGLIPIFTGGYGTEREPYLVSNATELNNVRNYVTSYFLQTADINLGIAPWNEGEGWVPIGNNPDYFKGNYDGDDFEISNLFIDRSGVHTGLFGAIYGATVKNTHVTNADIHCTGGDNTGTLVGNNYEYSVIDNCSSSGTVNSGGGYTGGLVGSSFRWTTISNSYSTCDVIAVNSDRIGGLTGYNGVEGSIFNCFATGDVTGRDYVGGLVGTTSNSTNTNCYSTGSTTGVNRVGGLSGGLYGGTIINCYSTGDVSGSSLTGGLAGSAENTFSTTDCFWDAETSGQVTSAGTATGKTTAEMMQDSTFTNWDFATVWGIQNGTSYPYLLWKGNFVAPADTPQNVVGEIVGSDFNLTWDAVADATSYKVYASEDPYGSFIDVSAEGAFTGESWSYIYTGTKRFFYVISETGAKITTTKKKIKRAANSSR